MRRIAMLAVLAGCSATTGLGGGVTIDGDRHLGLATEVHGGPVVSETVTAATGDGVPLAANLWMAGVELQLGAAYARPHGAVALDYYVEYLHMGTAGSPWGYHVRLAVGIGTHGVTGLPLGLAVGPNHLSSQGIADTNDGLIPHAVTSGIDLTATYRLNASCWVQPTACVAPPSPWEFGASYARQSSTYAPEVGMF